MLLMLSTASGQTYDRKYPTENIKSKQDDNKRKNEPRRKKISVIIKNDPKGLLYGNPCMEDETLRMGFKYSVQNPGLPGTLKPVTLFLQNLKVYTKLTLTRSPFWKVILNRRVKDCRERSGDWRG
jgi:hypothetical protein